ncbi:MAG TPA: hypothetical protein VK949_00750 [Methylotenera sp.]|nr:hypothetical protein [Methylotenera sp.]
MDHIPIDEPSSSHIASLKPHQPNPLDKYSLMGHLAELEKNTVEQTPALGNLAHKGQSTVIFSAPNNGKTLIIIHLTKEGISNGTLDPSKVYYLNMDDTGQGLLEKCRIAEEYGFHMLADGHKGFKTALFIDTIIYMIENDLCRDVVIILDTLKKFVDVMSKEKASRFSKYVRIFILKGGTLISLAHTNKKPDSNGKPVYGGTSDILDDCDCAYTLARVNTDKESTQKVVEFENIKRRGNVAQNAAYTYSLESNISYEQLLLSVSALDPNQLKPLKQAEAIKADAELIRIVKVCLLEGVNTKMRLADAVAIEAGISKRSALAVIEKYTGEDTTIHQWSFVVRERGAKVYQILKGSANTPVVNDPLY